MKCANLHDISGNVHDLFNLWIPRFNKLKKPGYGWCICYFLDYMAHQKSVSFRQQLGSPGDNRGTVSMQTGPSYGT